MNAKGKTIHQEQTSESIRFSALFTSGGSQQRLFVEAKINYTAGTYTITNPTRPMGEVFAFENQTPGSFAPAIGRLITKAAETAELAIETDRKIKGQ